jgi:DNA-binding response OmpR family regulator
MRVRIVATMALVLIIDDDPAQLSSLQGALGDTQYDFGTASSGREARAFLQSNGSDVDAILLDWRLPDCDGLELLDWVKEQPEIVDLEVVIQSTEFVPERVRAGIECGAYYYLTKPYEPAQLQAIVKSAVSSCRMKRNVATEVREVNDSLQMLDHGTFLLRTTDDARTLAVHLAAVCDDPDKGVGLLELMLNAIEHGNLGITYEDKSRLLDDGTHDAELERRLLLRENRDKRASVELKREQSRLLLKIRDRGPGFDYRKYLTVDPQRLFDSHGRGILLAGNVLDLEYVEPGNEVRVSIPLGDA